MSVRRIMYGTPFNFTGFEGWLNNMAMKGLILTKIIRPWCVFAKQEPRDMEYKLEPCSIGYIKRMREKYSSMGWTYVCRWKGICVFCTPRKADLHEAHDNSEEFGSIITRGRKALMTDVGKWMALFIIMMLALILIIGRNNTPWMNIFDKDAILLVAYFCLFCVVLTFERRDFLALKKHERGSVKAGEVITQTVASKKGIGTLNHVMAAMSIFIVVLLLMYVLVIPGVKLVRAVSEKNYELLTDEESSDFIRLNDIEKQDSSLLDTHWFKYDNLISRTRHLLYKQYNTVEQFMVTGEKWNEKEYSPYMRVECYEVFTEGLAERLVGDVIRTAESPDNWPQGFAVYTNEFKYEGLDVVYRIGNSYTGLYTLVARKGNRIINIMYYGKKPYVEMVEVITSKL